MDSASARHYIHTHGRLRRSYANLGLGRPRTVPRPLVRLADVPSPAPPLATLAAAAVLVAGLGGCGRGAEPSVQAPVIGVKGTQSKAAPALGFPVFATKNT